MTPGITNYRTRYEIAARHPDGRAYLVSYSPRISRHGLLKALQHRGATLIAKLDIGETDQIKFGVANKRAFAETAGWWIGFTGRTQLEARQSPLTFIEA